MSSININTWIQLNEVFEWLATPWLIVPPLLALVVVPWVTSFAWGKQWLSKPAAFGLALYLLISSSLFSSLAVWGLTVSLPADSGAVADAIVVLRRGKALEASRAELAAQLWQEERAAKILAIGDELAEAIWQRIEDTDSTPNSVIGLRCPRTTYQEAALSAALLGPQGVRKIILITDLLHLQRAYLSFSSFGWQVIPRASSLSSYRSVKVTWLSIREYLGLLSYWALGRFEPQPVSILTQPPAQRLRKLASHRCRGKFLGTDALTKCAIATDSCHSQSAA
ncbi:MAG: YdcF family protein [Cyanophyceae cyanobacterium]